MAGAGRREKEMTGRRGQRRSEAVKTGDDVPEPPKPSKAIDASDATVAARSLHRSCER